MLDVTSEDNAVLVPVKVVPGASKTRYMGLWNGRARIAVAAAPERGKANKAIVSFLADLFGVRRRDVTIVGGHGSRLKTIRIEGVDSGAARATLGPTDQ